MKLSDQISHEEFLQKLSGWGDIYFRMALLEKSGEWHLHSMVVDHKWPKSFPPPVTGLEPEFCNYQEATFVSGMSSGTQLASWIQKAVGTFTNKGRHIFFNLPQFPNPLFWYNRESNCNWHFSKLPWAYTSYHWTAASQQQDFHLYNSGPLTSDEQSCVTFPDLKSALLHFLHQPRENNSLTSDPIPVMGIVFRDAHPIWIKDVKINSNTVQVEVEGSKAGCLLEVPPHPKKEIAAPGEAMFEFKDGVPPRFFVYLLKDGELMDSHEQRPTNNGYGQILYGYDLASQGWPYGINQNPSNGLVPPDLALITEDSSLAEILKARWTESQQCIEARAYLAAVVMMGSLLEGALLAVIRDNTEASNRAASSPKVDRKPKPCNEWTLSELIVVAHECGWLKKDRRDFSDVLRDYRNIIHPRHQLQTKVNPDEGTTAICWEVVKATINDLITWNAQQKLNANEKK